MRVMWNQKWSFHNLCLTHLKSCFASSQVFKSCHLEIENLIIKNYFTYYKSEKLTQFCSNFLYKYSKFELSWPLSMALIRKSTRSSGNRDYPLISKYLQSIMKFWAFKFTELLCLQGGFQTPRQHNKAKINISPIVSGDIMKWEANRSPITRLEL